ncbi:TauD/TfdA family dioxygenase [Novosphingobium sp. G106]|uniref:TauD/TfdA dioxygenase family protein n=1 Tax=Novosphingobium sp. G106 TaxID=2849500 RepID=UPI001C2D9C18|nr:TauD/TfdA family dioxygenase [Novosphingobium sp. G106]MBV1686892.1 TauD/TfdA family dioxygenase [Novosphingobium sp. G106]
MATAAKARFASEEIKPRIGSRILADKEALLSGDYAAEIRELLEQRGVLVFPEIHFDDAEQIAFTSTLGKFAREMRGEDIYKITLDKSVTATADYLKATIFWHFDGFSSPMPIRASLLSSKVLSEVGGNTEFANTYAAYDALPEDDKAMLEGMQAVHCLASTQLDIDPQPSYAEWQRWLEMGRKALPLVWKHQSGRKSLVLGNSAHHVVGMDPLDSKGLLIRLRDWATQEQFVYSHEWTVGDLVMWDNTGSLHRAIPYEVNSKRMLHRTKLEGEEPIL